jgi:putative ABC transport system ATP-binding protein
MSDPTHDGMLVRARDLVRSYDAVRALDGLTCEVRNGEWLTIMGPSGSGKTTFLNILAGLDRPTAGEAVVAGQALSRLGHRDLAVYRRNTVGLVFQEFHLVSYLTALENVMLAQYVHSVTDEGEAAAALERVGLGHRTRHLPHQLSGGEKQRVCIARALINEPKIVLADEPTGNLDADNEARVLEILGGLHAAGLTLLVVTHNPLLAARGDRILRLEHGRAAGTVVPAVREERSAS